MANIAKRSDGRWRARYRDQAGQEHARHFGRRLDGQRWLDEVTASLLTGQYVDPRAGTLTFAQWFTAYAAQQVWVDGTHEAAATAADSVPFVDVPISRIAPSHVQAGMKGMTTGTAARPDGLAASTIRTRFNYVSMVFRAAVVDRVNATDPTKGVKLPRTRKAEHAKTLPGAGTCRSSARARRRMVRSVRAVCAFAGLRLGEAAGLQLQDLDFLGRTIAVRRQVQGATSAATLVPPKHGSERVVHVPRRLMTLLAEHVEQSGLDEPDSQLFATSSGHLVNRNVAQNGGEPDAVPPASRTRRFTTFDTSTPRASSPGCDVVTVQRALGHSSATITLNTYAHLWPTAENRTRAAATELRRQSSTLLRTRCGLSRCRGASDLRRDPGTSGSW